MKNFSGHDAPLTSPAVRNVIPKQEYIGLLHFVRIVEISSMLPDTHAMVKIRCKPDQFKAMEASLEDARVRSRYLEQALNSISDAFILYDCDGKLILCNQKHLEFYPHLANYYRPGARREDIWRHHAMKICESDPTIDAEAYFQARQNVTDSLRPDAERQLMDGRWVSARERPIKGGGTVAIRTDITDIKNMMADLEKKSREAIKSARKLRRAKNHQNDTY